MVLRYHSGTSKNWFSAAFRVWTNSNWQDFRWLPSGSHAQIFLHWPLCPSAENPSDRIFRDTHTPIIIAPFRAKTKSRTEKTAKKCQSAGPCFKTAADGRTENGPRSSFELRRPANLPTSGRIKSGGCPVDPARQRPGLRPAPRGAGPAGASGAGHCFCTTLGC